jgi:hypothetical protein
MESGTSSSRWTLASNSHRVANSWMWTTSRPCWRFIWLTQKLRSRAFLTVQLFCFDQSKILGAMYICCIPPNQDECQYLVFTPFPTVTTAATTKKILSCSLHGFPRPIHFLVSSTHSSHSHLNLRELTIFSRCKIPSPPSLVGRHTLSQLTWHFPLVTLS